MLKLSLDLEKIETLVDECIIENVVHYQSKIRDLEIEVKDLKSILSKKNAKIKEISERLLYLQEKIRSIIDNNYNS